MLRLIDVCIDKDAFPLLNFNFGAFVVFFYGFLFVLTSCFGLTAVFTRLLCCYFFSDHVTLSISVVCVCVLCIFISKQTPNNFLSALVFASAASRTVLLCVYVSLMAGPTSTVFANVYFPKAVA